MISLDQKVSQLRRLYKEGCFGDVQTPAMGLISSSNHPVSWSALVTVSARLGRLEGAYKSAKQALLTSPEDAQIQVNLGVVSNNLSHFNFPWVAPVSIQALAS